MSKTTSKVQKTAKPSRTELDKPKRAYVSTERIQYDPELCDEMLALIAGGKSVNTITKIAGFPSMPTFFKWLRLYPEFANNYARAKEEAAEAYAEQILEVNDKVLASKLDANSARVVSDNLKWISGKLKPKKYGDRIDLTTDGEKLPTPLIYIPQELSYRQVTDNRVDAIEGETVTA